MFLGKAVLQYVRRAKSALSYIKWAICNSTEIRGIVFAFARLELISQTFLMRELSLTLLFWSWEDVCAKWEFTNYLFLLEILKKEGLEENNDSLHFIAFIESSLSLSSFTNTGCITLQKHLAVIIAGHAPGKYQDLEL